MTPSRTRLVAASAGLAGLALVLVAVPARADASYQGQARTWQAATGMLGSVNGLWEPAYTAGLRIHGQVSVVADGLTTSNARITGGDTFAGATYGRGTKTLSVSEKWRGTGWAAEPAFSTAMAPVGRVTLVYGDPGTQWRVRAQVSANCFRQPANADPKPVPAGYRCTRADVLRTGGILTMNMRAGSTMNGQANVAIVMQSTGLSYDDLLTVARGLSQTMNANDAGSAQMLGMCQQMIAGRMTSAQASAFATSNGFLTRVGSIDGVPQAVTADYNPDRFTLALKAGAVSGCTYG